MFLLNIYTCLNSYIIFLNICFINLFIYIIILSFNFVFDFVNYKMKFKNSIEYFYDEIYG